MFLFKVTGRSKAILFDVGYYPTHEVIKLLTTNALN